MNAPADQRPPSDTDIWVLAGQSNMAGSGLGEPYEPPSDRVWLYTLADEWKIAEEPFMLDRYEAVDDGFAIMRSEIPRAEVDPDYRRKQSPAFRKTVPAQRAGGGLGLPFGKALTDYTGRPVGLLYCAKGDTRMEEWDPAWDGTPFMALYRGLLRRIRKMDRPVTGVLWYQGESDTFDEKGGRYRERMLTFVRALRRDLGRPGLPFFYVQLGNCFAQPEDELPDWNLVQEEQRRLEPDLAPGGLCAAIDLPLSDGIHIATAGHRRLGARLARLVRHAHYGDATLQPGPRPAAVARDPANPLALTVHFDSVNGRLFPATRVAGFSVFEPGGTRNLVCRACVPADHPHTVRLTTLSPPPPQSTLWYGRGLTPFCNLVDAEDMAAPVFGPWPIP